MRAGDRGAESVTTTQERAQRLSGILHRQMGVWEPCRTACIHYIEGAWTVLGVAEVLARVERRERIETLMEDR